MRKISSLLIYSVILLLLPLFSSWAANFNGYIVKFKDSDNFNFHSKSLAAGSFTKIGNGGEYFKLESSSLTSAKSENFQRLLANLKKNPAVEYVEPNYILKANIDANGTKEVVSDQYFSRQWGLLNTGDNSGGWFSSGVAGVDIHATDAWKITRGSKDVLIAVIDTGVNYNHPDLAANIWTNEAEANGVAGIDDDNNGFIDDVHGYDFVGNDGDPMDDQGHGTHCAGVIGASHNNIGVRGVMNDVNIMALKFLGANGEGDVAGAIGAIEYAIKMNAKVLSNSWGGSEFSQALGDMIAKANESGVVFVVAAGNESSNNDSTPTWPTNFNYDNVISVAALTGAGTKAYFSNYGKTTVHVFAPGDGIFSTFKNGYQSLSGTSMSAPFVSGIVGLMVAKDSTLDPLTIRNRLIETVTKYTKLANLCVSNGAVDAAKVLSSY